MNNCITIVIPFHTTIKGRLINAVNSVLAQSYQSFEIIIVDDYSPILATDELCNIDDFRINIIRHEANTNGGVARNTGVSAAVGNYVAFLDYDDIWYKNKLIKQLELIQELNKKYLNPVVYAKSNIVLDHTTYEKPSRPIRETEKVSDYLFVEKEIIQTSGIFLSTQLAKAVKFDDLKRHQDYQFCLSLENKGCNFFMLDEPLYSFIQVPKLNDYNFSMNWFDNYHFFLTDRAKLAFKKLVVFRSMLSHSEYSKGMQYALQQKFFFSGLILCVFYLFKKSLNRKVLDYLIQLKNPTK
jgi:glycosyltransferase involved in cell wall biosynthesis